MESVDIAIVGGGIAGMSAAFFLSQSMSDASIGVFEAESTLTHHTTGRSAAVFIENYGAAAIRPLTLASRSFYFDPPTHLVDAPLLTRKGMLSVAGPDDDQLLAASVKAGQAINPDIGPVDAATALQLAPMLRPELVKQAIYEPDASGIDVAGLHQAFVRGFRAAGGSITTTRKVDAATADGDRWHISTTTGPVAAGYIVNTSGAWGDVVATTAGVAPVGLQPKRRTAFMVNSPFPESHGWPLIADIAHRWYANPDGSQFLCSPADETDSEPCDARPEEVDIALAIERINSSTTLGIRGITSSWAGLRTFSPDRAMVIGPEPEHPNFIWCVGQGGTGIQTAPGSGQLVADLIGFGKPQRTFDGTGLELDLLSPDRFRV
ncbi:MAG: D-arginine dehydrogenase [Acidimicrobiales bacterium]|jgi:D-arginine dehydrogenase